MSTGFEGKRNWRVERSHFFEAMSYRKAHRMWLGKYYNWNLRAIQLAYMYFSVSDLGTQMHSLMILVLDPPSVFKGTVSM